MRRDTGGSLQHAVSLTLRAGVVVSAGVGLVAGLYELARDGGHVVAFRHFHGTSEADRRVSSILANAFRLEPRALMMVALLLLVLTPILRVIVTLIGFVKERDRIYVVVTTMVLLTLLGSLIFGGTAE